MKLADRALNTQEYYFSKKLKEVAHLREQGKNIINLGIGSPDRPASSSIVNALVKSAKTPSSHGYAPYGGLESFKSAIKNWHAKFFQTQLDAKKKYTSIGRLQGGNCFTLIGLS